MIDFIFWYFFGLLVAANIQVVWAFTNMPLYIFKLFNIKSIKNQEVYTREEFEDWLLINLDKFGEMLSCPICMSTHTSWIISFLIYFLTFKNINILFMPVLTWPVLIFLIYSFLKKLNH